MQPAADTCGAALCWRPRRSRALLAVAGSILMGAAPAAAAPGLCGRCQMKQGVLCHPEGMESSRKVTVKLPDELLRRAQRTTGRGITATIRRGLELVAAGRAYEELQHLRGKIALSIDLERLREDR